MLLGYDELLMVVDDFRDKKIDWRQFKLSVLDRGSGLGRELEYPGDWDNVLDAWLEAIEFCYREESRYELGCSLGEFLRVSIETEPRPLRLPTTDRVIRDHFTARE
jgi:hypothetical protein